MNLLKFLNRRIISPSAMFIGGDKIIRFMSSNNILIVMYHGVVNNDSNYFSPRHLHIDQFDRQIKYLKKEFDIITIEEAFYLKDKKANLKNKSIVITFDDGYLNNLKNALPVLESYNVHANFFISTICLENENYVLWPDLIAGLNYFFPEETNTQHFQNYLKLNNGSSNIYESIKQLSPLLRDELLDNLVKRYDLIEKLKTLPSEIWKLMTKDDIIQLSKSKNVSIGSHGHLHYNLANITLQNAQKDLLKSKELLESALMKNIDSIAFPDGSYNKEVIEICNTLGFRFLLGVNANELDAVKNLNILFRHGISSSTTYESNILSLNKSFYSKGF